MDKGLAEVTYIKLEHAKEAIAKYDRNELDGIAPRAITVIAVNTNRS